MPIPNSFCCYNYTLGSTYGYLVARIYKQSNFNSIIRTSTGAKILIWMICQILLSLFGVDCMQFIFKRYLC